MGVFVFWILLSLLVGALSTEKTIGFWGGFFFSLLLSPIIGIIIALASRDRVSVQVEKNLIAKMTQGKDVTEKLLNLKKLKDEGVVNEDEYETMRKKLLGI